MILNVKNLYKNVKENFKEGDKIVMNADADISEDDFSLKKKRMQGTIIKIGEYHTLVRLKNYHTCIHNHQMLTDKSIRRRF